MLFLARRHAFSTGITARFLETNSGVACFYALLIDAHLLEENERPHLGGVHSIENLLLNALFDSFFLPGKRRIADYIAHTGAALGSWLFCSLNNTTAFMWRYTSCSGENGNIKLSAACKRLEVGIHYAAWFASLMQTAIRYVVPKVHDKRGPLVMKSQRYMALFAGRQCDDWLVFSRGGAQSWSGCYVCCEIYRRVQHGLVFQTLKLQTKRAVYDRLDYTVNFNRKNFQFLVHTKSQVHCFRWRRVHPAFRFFIVQRFWVSLASIFPFSFIFHFHYYCPLWVQSLSIPVVLKHGKLMLLLSATNIWQ